MVPSLAGREPRRSSRRHTDTPASRTSLSPSSTNHFPALSDPNTPPTPSRALPHPPLKRSSNGNRRVKQEPDDILSQHSNRPYMDDATNPPINGRSKRKPKDKVEVVLPAKFVPDPPPQDLVVTDPGDDNDDDGGITRCVCGRTELDADEEDLGLMVMCETCKVWQHGVCVNLAEDMSEQDYYCELCRPDLHVDLLKSLKKRARQSSQHNRRHSASVPRSSRSHSPGHALAAPKAPKRRNTMNSRDADYEEALKQLIESTRPESERYGDGPSDKDDQQDEPSVIIEIVSGARKKRKRNLAEEKVGRERTEMSLPKRNRSNSSTPDRHVVTSNGMVNGAMHNGSGAASRQASTSSGAGVKPPGAVSAKPKRGRKEAAPPVDDDPNSKRHANQYTYRKPVAPTPPRRPGANGVHPPNGHGAASTSSGHDHGTRRNAHAPHLHAPPPPQPLLTTWGLPDYLTHLSSELPTEIPQPVEVRIFEVPGEGAATEAAPSVTACEDIVLERGVKVKWPAKRTNVGDMNKRVRGIIDWVGREQASASARRRRRDALNQALQEQGQPDDPELATINGKQPAPESEATHLMEELMKELIAFQEKFGPGSKGKERDRRAAG
ncbi:hypothetical protein BU17DRAFT_95635 [Hysterangium stoloniferum]|nr:hypothetical protein BU17DRAFT_95635 [Hysterangium stoloniferum]